MLKHALTYEDFAVPGGSLASMGERGSYSEGENISLAQKSKKPALKAGFLNLAPLTGLEPVTYGLTVRRSTD